MQLHPRPLGRTAPSILVQVMGDLYAVKADGTKKWRLLPSKEMDEHLPPAIGATAPSMSEQGMGTSTPSTPTAPRSGPLPEGLYTIPRPLAPTAPSMSIQVDDNSMPSTPTAPRSGPLPQVLVYSSPAIGADGTIYVGSGGGKLYAINPDGTLKWAFPPVAGGLFPGHWRRRHRLCRFR